MKLQLYSWNVNGIRAAQRKGFVDWIKQTEPDILCIQETKAHKKQLDSELTETEGYHIYFDEAEKKGYSGTAIYSIPEPSGVTYGLPDDIAEKYELTDSQDRDAVNEGRIVTAEYDDFFVSTVYTPNAKDTLERIPLRHKAWDPAYLEYMKRLDKKKPVIFCGDLNVAHTEDDLARPKQNVGKKGFTDEEREGLQNYIDAGFIDTYRMFHEGNGHYTWWSNFGNARERNVGWRIDYFFISERMQDKVLDAEIHDEIMGSDHAPISLTLEL